jgi:hypothetical protein
MCVLSSSSVQAQDPVTQTATVGVVFVEFSDAGTNPDARGGIGYTAPPRVPDGAKYQAQFWHDFFFKQEGHVSHPDSLTHLNQWSGDWALTYYASLARWCRANSYGRHNIEPVDRPVIDGILNNITDGKIDWIPLTTPKSDFLSNSTDIITSTITSLNGRGLSEYLDCDVVFVVYAGAGSRQFASGSYAVISEKTQCCDSPPNEMDFVLSFYMSAAVHEYIHAYSIADAGVPFINDYAYDLRIAGDFSDESKRARWLGLSGMYMHGPQNRPYHLDPWAKLVLGWINYQILTPGEYHDVSLPVIAQPDDGVVPTVLVIPIDVPWDPANPDWMDGHYLIVENRRRIPGSFDQNITSTESAGGFLVWEYDDRLLMDQRGGLTVVEADSRYDMKYLDHFWVYSQLPAGTAFPYHIFDPTAADFWSASSILSTWSHHVLGMLDPTSMRNTSYNPALSSDIPRQVTIRFGTYTNEGDENVIPYISVGQPTSNTSAATSNNNQRKMIKTADELVFVATSDFAGEEAAGTITVHTSPDGGEHWTGMRILNEFDVWRDPTEVEWDPALPAEEQDLNRWLPSIRTEGAIAPAITRISDSWGVTWQQREGGGQSRVLFSSPQVPPWDIVGAGIDRLNDDVTPVIAWGRIDPTTSTELLKIVYCTDSGLMEVVSTDRGVSFGPPSTIPETTSLTRNPSLAMSPDHEILVYEHQNSIFAVIDGATSVNLSAMHPEFLRSMTPSVTIAGNTAHVVWTAEIEEPVEGISKEPIPHIKPAHKLIDLTASVDHNVATILNTKYNRLEEARFPVIATKHTLGSESEAVLMWSVFDLEDGARLRYAETALNPATSEYEWPPEGTESALSTQPTHHPAIAGDAGETRFIVTRGAEPPYRIQCAAPAPLPIDPFVGEKEVLISVLDHSDYSWQNMVRIEDVEHYSQAGALLRRAANAGVPFAGFDGSHDGPPLSLLSMSEEIFLGEQDTLKWTLQVHRAPTNRYDDTTAFRVDMLDGLDSTVIASSISILIPPDKIDSIVTVAFLLPPSHHPAATVRLSLDVDGDAYDHGLRYYTATKNVFMTTGMQKRANRERDAAPLAPSTPAIEAYPQPAGTTLRLVQRLEPAVHATVTMHDCLGRILKSRSAEAGSDGMLRVLIDVADLRPGVYDCRITAGGRCSRRMVSIVR